jgi:hypothetical protein
MRMDNNSELLPPLYVQEIVEDVMRRKSVGWVIPDCGLSAAHRYSVELEDGSRVFVKAAKSWSGQRGVWDWRARMA